MFQGDSLYLRSWDSGIVELCFDRANAAINKFDNATVLELKMATAELRAWNGLKGVLVSSAKSAFIVGADIFEFNELFARPEKEIESHIAAQNGVFAALEDLPVPVVTAINGFALGGGLEQALASDYRIAADTAQLGLPEVNLGLIPGYGGTVRLPRVAGMAIAIDWISTGRPRSAEIARKDRVVDAVVPPNELREAALSLLNEVILSGAWRVRRIVRSGSIASNETALQQAKGQLRSCARLQPAALAAVELIESCANLGRAHSLRQEHAAFARIARTQAAASMVQLFVNEQLIKDKVRTYAKRAHQIARVGVLGAGIMGGGIAYSSAARGVPVLMKDIAPRALQLGMGEARRQFDKQIEAARLSTDNADALMASITPQLDYQRFDTLDVVVEAVVENIEVKKAVLREVEQRVRIDAIIASNTSSLSIATMAEVLARPERFIGMHFFNPVPIMPLVEVIRGPRTSAETVVTAAGFVAAMGKTPVVVKDCPGFLVNRLLTAYMVGYFNALHDGADYLRVDSAMEGFGWPMGPAFLQDVIGLDTMASVVDVITGSYSARMRMDFVLPIQRLLERRRLGQKNGHGYHRYESDGKGKPIKLIDSETAALVAGLQSHGPRDFGEQEIVERLMMPMIIEAAICLEEGVVESAAEVDIALVLGLGFPRHAGGPLKYADWLGLKQVIERCNAYASLGPMYVPTPRMRAMARNGGRYFSSSYRQFSTGPAVAKIVGN